MTFNVELKMTSFVKCESNLGRIAIDCIPFHVFRRVSLLLKSVCSLTRAILRRSNTTTHRSQEESMEKGHYNSYTEVCFGYFGRSSSNSDSIFPKRSLFWVLSLLMNYVIDISLYFVVRTWRWCPRIPPVVRRLFLVSGQAAHSCRGWRKRVFIAFLRVSAHEQRMVKSITIEDIVFERMMERWEETSCSVAQMTRKSSPELRPRTFIHGSRHAKCHAIRESYRLDFLPVPIVFVFLVEFDSVNDIR